ncbi:MAG: mechanosensitive ion channel family protein [Patescibacteria group bacterium]
MEPLQSITSQASNASDVALNPSSSALVIKITDLFFQFWQSEWKLIAAIIAAPILQLLIRFLSPLFLRVFLIGFSGGKKDSVKNEKRIKTVSSVISATSLVFIFASVIVVFLSQIGINMTPIITGAGILSLAVGFGAQSLIKDIIAGLFIILENQFNQGDWVKIDSFEGRVVEITLRRTVLQTPKGARHIIPNGQIKIVTNSTNQYSAVSLNIPAKVDDNFNKVNKIINQIGEKLAKDPEFKKHIIETPEAIGVNEISGNAAIIKVWGKTKPGKQLLVKRELAERIVREFSKRSIKLPGKILK